MQNSGPLGRLSIKTAVVLAFGLTLAIWLVAGYDSTQRINDTRARARAITARYTAHQELLSTVREQLLLVSVTVRDALLDPNLATTDYLPQIEEMYAEVNQALQEYLQYLPLADWPIEGERVERLRQEIGDFRQTTLQVLGADSGVGSAGTSLLLRTQVVPQRDVVIEVLEEVGALNHEVFLRRQAEIADINAASLERFWISLVLALVASGGVAVLAIVYTGRLESRLQRELAQNEQSARDLQHLSAKLTAAQEDERRRIARELHDEIGQGLTAIKVELAVAERALVASGVDARVLAGARSIAEGSLAAVRELSHLLHPVILDDLGLTAAVEWLVQRFGQRHDIRSDVLHLDLAERLAPEIETAIYRIVQEALTNVAKHARASACRVHLQRLTNTVLITIDDNGVGFDPAGQDRADAFSGLGLIGMRDRAAQLRGTFRVESAPGKGTRLVVELPARPRALAADDPVSDELPGVDRRATLHG